MLPPDAQHESSNSFQERPLAMSHLPTPDRVTPPGIVQPFVRLRTRLERFGPLRDVRLDVPRTPHSFHILQPESIDPFLDAVEFDPEQNLPYWAELWPSGLALAGTILRHGGALYGKRALEIGSGLGVTAIAAIAAGARLTVADYSSTSLLFCRYNALRNTGRQPRTFQLNWRQPSKGLLTEAASGFDAILAADILYESRDVEPLLALIDRLITPSGILWLAEPGRPVARVFLDALRRSGWSGTVEHYEGPWPDPKDVGVRVRVHRLRRARTAG
ncbi:Methyltransferase type 12 [Nitrolancea hollandica Lb]|uniref:Methyltransferase type 12 n=2 Tax=Nitrolancea hollandica TaxID=1206749 RepID=I4EG78_9BACT|nr:Methyltransferase type 12 [Nitrolancea hollandica Lb]